MEDRKMVRHNGINTKEGLSMPETVGSITEISILQELPSWATKLIKKNKTFEAAYKKPLL